MKIIEMLVVVAVLAIIIGVMANGYSNFVDRQRMNDSVEGVISIIQKARTLTLSGKDNFFYSIHIDTSTASTPNQLVLFKGNDYTKIVNRIEVFTTKTPIIINPVTDPLPTKLYPVPNNTEFIFQRLSGAVLLDTEVSQYGVVGCMNYPSCVATTTLDTTSASTITFKSTTTGITRTIRIYKSGALEVQ